MNTIIKGVSVSDAWKKAINHLVANDKEDYNLIVEIENPVSDDIYIRNNFNKVLHSMGDQSVETVSNTIFPLGMYEKVKTEITFTKDFQGFIQY